MFRLVVFAICILLASCAQQHPAPPDLPANQLALGPVSSGAASLATQPRPKNLHNDSGEHHNATGSARGSQKIIPLAYHRTTRGGVTLSLVTFDDREHQLRVADQPKGPGTRWNDARSAAKTYSGLAAINGGFFTPEGKPLGLLTETGTRRGYLNNSSLGAGLFVSAKSGSAIIRGQRYGSSSLAAKAYNLLQAGPMLVEGGKPISGLSKASRRPRSFITWDGKNHWAIGFAEPCTLDQLSQSIAGATVAGLHVHSALNLDGGRSSDLWVGPNVRNGNQSHRTFLNRVVRNYLVLIPR